MGTPFRMEEDLAERLFPPEPSEIEWGLDRTRALLAELGDPQRSAPVLHVGGTNGKGSVAALAASVLQAHGLKVGLYTSPHLLSLRERFRVDGAPVRDQVLLSEAEDARPLFEAAGASHFEAATVLAFQVFRRMEVEVCVVEVGLGGRLDATNVVEPVGVVVTNVDLDHREYLGNTLEEVALEKAGILKAGVPAVVGEPRPALRRIFRRVAEERGAILHLVEPDRELLQVECEWDGTAIGAETAPWGKVSLRSPLVGLHQPGNLLLALRALERLPVSIRPTRTALGEGFSQVVLPGRLQVVDQAGVRWILDVAHNPAGARALSRTLDALVPPRPVTLLAGVLGDKDWKSMLRPLAERVDRVLLTDPPGASEARRWDPQRAARYLAPLVPTEVRPEFAEALRLAKEGGSGSVVVTGSSSVVGEALRRLAPSAKLSAP